jgi:hypothetical protein
MQDELKAMKSIANALEPLDVRARSRVLSWITSALDVGGVQQPAAPLGAGATATGGLLSNQTTGELAPTRPSTALQELLDEDDYTIQ